MKSSEEKLAAVEKAIFELQSGKRVTTVQYGDTKVEYASIDLDDLLSLRSQILAASETPPRRYVHFTTSKGLR